MSDLKILADSQLNNLELLEYPNFYRRLLPYDHRFTVVKTLYRYPLHEFNPSRPATHGYADRDVCHRCGKLGVTVERQSKSINGLIPTYCSDECATAHIPE